MCKPRCILSSSESADLFPRNVDQVSPFSYATTVLQQISCAAFLIQCSFLSPVLPPPPIEAAKPRTPSKQTPLRKTPSSSTLLSIAAAGDAPKRSASQPPQSWANNAKPLSKSSKAPHENKGIVSSRGARLPASRPPQKVLPVPGGKVETANSTAAAQSFLAGLQAKGPVSKQDGNDLVFTFSDDSEDEASAGESLQSEMERVRKQLQKLESGRNVRERSVPAEESESRSNGGRPESGGSKAGPLSRFAGRLGPLKGVSTVGAKGVLVSVTGGLKPGSKDPPTNIVAKAVSVETALEEMRRKVASMEQEMKQTGKPGRPATPPVGQKRKAVVQPVGGKEDKKRPAQGIAQKAGIDGRALGVFARLGEVKAAPVGAVPSAKASGVLDSRKGGLVEKGLKSLRAPQEKETVPSGNGPSAQEGPGVGGSKIKAEKGSTNTTYKQEPETSHGPAAAPSGKPSVTLTSQEGTQGTRPGSAPTPLRDKPLEGSAAQPGRTSPSKRKSSPSDYSHPPLKQPKLENELPETALRTAHNGATLQEASLASSATESTLQGVPKSGELDSSAPVVASSPLLTTAELPAEAGALVPLALGVTSAEPGVTSAELQLAALAQDEERCWAALREGEKEAAEKKSKLEDLQRALAEAERAEREAREQVLVTRERLEANRRLRVELELRDRMEKRLRAMLERGQREEIHTGGLVARDGGLQIEDSVRGDGLEAAELREGSGGASLGAGPGIAAGGDGAVWMHEAHEGGYVVSQLEEHETGEPPSGRVEGTRGTAVRAGGVSEVVLEKEGAAAQGGDVLVKELIAVETGKDLAGGDDSARRASPETAGTPAAVQSSGGRTPQRDIPGGLMVKEQLNGASVPVVESPRQGSDGQKATGGDGETAHGVSVAEGRSFRANVPVRDGVSRPSQVCKQAPGESVPRQAGERSNELAENAVGPSDANVPPSTGEKSPKESEFRPVVDLQADSQRQVEGLRVQAASAETHSPVESAQPAAESGAHCEQVAEEGGRARGQEVGRKRPPESDGARMGGASGSRRVPVHSSVKAEGRLPKRPRVEEEEGSSEGEGWSGVALEDEILRKDTVSGSDFGKVLTNFYSRLSLVVVAETFFGLIHTRCL